jgi:hypothetical protein
MHVQKDETAEVERRKLEQELLEGSRELLRASMQRFRDHVADGDADKAFNESLHAAELTRTVMGMM